MSPKATELIRDLLLSEFGYGKDEAAEALKQYIDELERKAQECDDLKAANKRLAKYHADHP